MLPDITAASAARSMAMSSYRSAQIYVTGTLAARRVRDSDRKFPNVGGQA
jgi:hypothetical protein